MERVNLYSYDNKKYKLKEFISSNEIKNDIIKINMILSKELSNISHLFDNCAKLKEIFFCDDTRFIDDKGPHLLEEYNDYDNDIYFNFNGNSSDNFSEHSLYKNLRIDDIYSNCSTITNKTEEKYNNSTINDIRDKIIICEHNYYYDMSYMFIIVDHYYHYLIYQNGILIMLMIWNICFLIVDHYHHYQIYQNGILIML